MGVIRLSIPFVAILLGLAAFAAHPADRGTTARPPETAGQATGPSVTVAGRAPAPAPESASQPVPKADRATAALPGSSTVFQAVPEPHVRNRLVIVALLERELSLAPDQRRQVEDVLLRREREIDGHHRQLRALGAVSGQAYHRHMQELRTLSYIQIGQALDSEQHHRFLALVANGALNDGIGFAMDEGMVQVD